MAVDESINIVVKGKDEASSTLSGIGKSLGSAGEAFAKFGAIAGTALVAGAAALGAFAKSSFDAFVESEKQMAVATKSLQNTFDNLTKNEVKKLKVDLESTTVRFEQIEKAMNDAGNAAVKLGMDDEEAAASFAKLFSITKGVTAAEEELAIAMDLAAFSGRSLDEATKALVMVHAGGTKVLKEFGIEVKEGTTAAEALALVQEKVTGSAEAMANTTAGKMAVLSISWQNLKEKVGETLAQAVTPFIEQLTAFANSPEVQEQLQGISQKIAGMAAQLAPLIQQMLPLAISLLNGLVGVLKFLGQAFQAVTGFLANVIYAIMQFIDWVKKIPEEVNRAIAALNQLASKMPGSGGLGFTNKIGDAISGALNIGGRAAGGPVSAGVPYIVGEQGPELFLPSQSGQIMPNGSFGMGGIVINISGTFLDQFAAEKVGDLLIDRLKQELRI